MTLPTPSQTVGPFYGFALPFPGGGEMVPVGRGDSVILWGFVYDGAGDPVPDALLEFWQGGGAPGSLSRGFATAPTGFGRVATDASGAWAARVKRPAPYLSVCVFARGLLHHLFTRIYVDASLAARHFPVLDEARRSTLVASEEKPTVYRFDIRLQGAGETVFLEFR